MFGFVSRGVNLVRNAQIGRATRMVAGQAFTVQAPNNVEAGGVSELVEQSSDL